MLNKCIFNNIKEQFDGTANHGAIRCGNWPLM